MTKKIISIFLVTMCLLLGGSTFSVLGKDMQILKTSIDHKSVSEPLVFAKVNLGITWNNPEARIVDLKAPFFWNINNNPLDAALEIYVYALAGIGERLIGDWTITLSDSQGHEIGWKRVRFNVYIGPSGVENLFQQWTDSEAEEWNLRTGMNAISVSCDATWEKYTWDAGTWSWKLAGMGEAHAYEKSDWFIAPKLFNHISSYCKENTDTAYNALKIVTAKRGVFSTPWIVFMEIYPNIFPMLRYRLGL